MRCQTNYGVAAGAAVVDVTAEEVARCNRPCLS